MYGDEKFIESSYATMHQQIDANTFLVAKGKTGCVGLVDLRSGYQSVVQDYNVFDRKFETSYFSINEFIVLSLRLFHSTFYK